MLKPQKDSEVSNPVPSVRPLGQRCLQVCRRDFHLSEVGERILDPGYELGIERLRQYVTVSEALDPFPYLSVHKLESLSQRDGVLQLLAQPCRPCLQ